MSNLTIDSFKPGQAIRCTLAKMPRAQGLRDTVAKLMRLDPDSKRSLRRAQDLRRQRMVVYNRGNRDWVSRERPAKVIRMDVGEAWSMPFRLELLPELQAVGSYLTIEPA